MITPETSENTWTAAEGRLVSWSDELPADVFDPLLDTSEHPRAQGQLEQLFALLEPSTRTQDVGGSGEYSDTGGLEMAVGIQPSADHAAFELSNSVEERDISIESMDWMNIGDDSGAQCNAVDVSNILSTSPVTPFGGDIHVTLNELLGEEISPTLLAKTDPMPQMSAGTEFEAGALINTAGNVSTLGTRDEVCTVDTSIHRHRFSEGAAPSKYCHVCGRSSVHASMHVCHFSLQNLCRKVVCHHCVAKYDSDFTLISDNAHIPWSCTHCRGVCPRRARCVQYFRNNERRRVRNMQRRLGRKWK